MRFVNSFKQKFQLLTKNINTQAKMIGDFGLHKLTVVLH